MVLRLPGGHRGRTAGTGASRGYLTRHDAAAAWDALLHRSAEDRGVEAWTVARWLRYWLTTRSSIRPFTLRSYAEHVELHLIPHLGRVWLAVTGDIGCAAGRPAGTPHRD